MEKKTKILTDLALVCDKIDELSFKTIETKISLYLNENDFDEIYYIFLEKKLTDKDTSFSIYIDNVNVEINKKL